MLEWISKILSTQEHPIALAVAAVYGLNALLTGLKVLLDRIKDKTVTNFDNKMDDIVTSILSWVSKTIGFLTANKAVLPESVKDEVNKV